MNPPHVLPVKQPSDMWWQNVPELTCQCFSGGDLKNSSSYLWKNENRLPKVYMDVAVRFMDRQGR